MTEPQYGETWAYESIVGGLPGFVLSRPAALALQVVAFESALLALAWWYGLWGAVPAGTVAVGVAGVGSLAMVRIGDEARALSAPSAYTRFLFGSSLEVVLTVLAFVALVTYLFVVDPVGGGSALLDELFSPSVPAPVAYLALLVLWDLCYRIGASWWTAVANAWAVVQLDVPAASRARFRRLCGVNVAFAAVQLALVPFVTGHPVLLWAVVGHVAAVVVVSGAAAWRVGR